MTRIRKQPSEPGLKCRWGRRSSTKSLEKARLAATIAFFISEPWGNLSWPFAHPEALPTSCPTKSGESGAWSRPLETFSNDMGMGEIRTPIVEETALFTRNLGETTDIVEKEMFTLATKDEEGSLTLRPEATVGVARAYLQHSYHKTQPLAKFYVMGPMFRYERPQAGRSRQFDQIGVELLGSTDPLADAEIIALAANYFAELGLTGYSVHVNSIGCPGCRAEYRKLLSELLKPNLGKLCELCQKRYERNVFRVLDCKKPACREIASHLPPMLKHLCSDCAKHFEGVKAALDQAGVTYLVDAGVVRGFDYYTRTVFEIMHQAVGARSAICGGGRYDNLIEELGGPPTGACGFSVGVVPLTVVMDKLGIGTASTGAGQVSVFVAAADESTRLAAFRLTQELRRGGVSAETDYAGRSLKAQMRQANKMNARFVIVMGPEEVKSSAVNLKNMQTSQERNVRLEEVVEAVKKG